jgi:hypothetical protein
MTDPLSRLATCQRPKLLVSASRIGSLDYARKPALRRLLGAEGTISPRLALEALMMLEADHDALRREGCATYSVARHVEILACVMGEARLLRESLAPRACPSGPSGPVDHTMQTRTSAQSELSLA